MQVAAEHGRERMDIGQIEITERRDRNIELQRIYPSAKQFLLLSTVQYFVQGIDERRVERPHSARTPQVSRPMQVLAIEQGEEFRVVEKILPGKGDQLADRFDRWQGEQVQLALGVAYGFVSIFQNREEQIVLALKVVIQHALVRPGATRHIFDSRSA